MSRASCSNPFHRFSYVTAHSSILLSLHLGHSLFSNHSVASHSSLILQPFRRLTYVTAHSPALPSLHLRRSFLIPSVASPTPQLILQPFYCFTYITWRAAHGLVVSEALSLNLNSSFLNRISLLLISSSYPIVLTRLDEFSSRPYISRKISRVGL